MVAADELARLRNDSLAWARVAPGCLFVHSTGAVDDLASFQRFRARGAAGRVGSGRDAAAPHLLLDGDTFVRVRVLGDSAAPGTRPGQSRVTDVFVRRDGEWQWLAHQSAEVSARWREVAAPAGELGEYAGTYVAGDGRRRTYRVRGETLVQVLDGGAAAAERQLMSLGLSSFGYEGLNATLTFVRDASGRVVGAAESAQVGFTSFRRSPP